jgi:hypothetical protein
MNEAEFIAYCLNCCRDEIEMPQCERTEHPLSEVDVAPAGCSASQPRSNSRLRTLVRRLGHGIIVAGERLAEANGDPYWPRA